MIVLAATEARSATDIASELGTSQLAVLRAVHRYRNHGVASVTNPLS
jgi:biotin operon repressor